MSCFNYGVFTREIDDYQNVVQQAEEYSMDNAILSIIEKLNILQSEITNHSLDEETFSIVKEMISEDLSYIERKAQGNSSLGNQGYDISNPQEYISSIKSQLIDVNPQNQSLFDLTDDQIQERKNAIQEGLNSLDTDKLFDLKMELNNKQRQISDIEARGDFGEGYHSLAGEVESRNVQTRLKMAETERKSRSPQSTEDVKRDDQLITHNAPSSYILNEDPNSEFAKAVEAIANGERSATSEISLGTTPDVLKMLGIDDANVVIHAKTLQKDMIGKHSVSAEAMKQLPKQLNDPIAVVQSRPDSTNPKAYLMLTELKEIENGKELPVIAALNFVQHDNGDLELVEISSAYGRKNVKVAKDLLYKPYYWNKTKGNQFLKDFALSAENNELLSTLRSSFSSDDYLSVNNVKSEDDLRQYQSENSDNIRYSVKQSVDDLAKTGKAKQDASQMSKLRSFDGFKSLVKDVGGWLDERVTDGLRPVNDWIDTFKQSGISDHEAERLKDDMYRAKGVRDALNSELESAYLNPIIKKVAAIAKANKMDELSAKRLAGYWISGRYAIEKNNSLLK